jgi:hypothetical protein
VTFSLGEDGNGVIHEFASAVLLQREGKLLPRTGSIVRIKDISIISETSR